MLIWHVALPTASSAWQRERSYSMARRARSRTANCCRFTAEKDGWSERDGGLGTAMTVANSSARRIAFPPNWSARITLVALAIYALYASTILDITWPRFIAGLGHGARFISRMWPPNVAPDKLELLTRGMIESLQIAIIATVVGVLLALPLGLAAARNLAPPLLAWTARALIALFRT